MPIATSAKVRKASQASCSQLLQCALNGIDTPMYSVSVLLSAEIEQADRDSIWTIFESNMRVLYSKSSFGWNPADKEEELFSTLSRSILIRIDNELVAFSMFRFEYEEGENVLYCYDLQIQASHKRRGLGRLLVQMLENIGAEWGMEKLMLTVFKANKNAIQFYHVCGFTMDESCPGYFEDEQDDVDYEILSKRL